MASAHPKLLIRLAEIFGIKIPDSVSVDQEKVIEIFKLHNRHDDYLEMIVFMKKADRENLNPFLFKIQKIITQYITTQPWYINVDIQVLQTETKQLIDSLKYNQIKYYADDRNDGKSFLSLDIKAANFMALKKIAGDNVKTDSWSEFFKSLIPNDTRGTGEVTSIPQCIYTSKFIRQFILGEAKKLKYIWQLENTRQLHNVCSMNIDNAIYINSDEIVITIDNFEEGDKILSNMVINKSIYRIRKFTLKKIPGYSKNTMLKLFDDGSKGLINARPNEYAELHEKFLI